MKPLPGCEVQALREPRAQVERVLYFATESRLYRGSDGRIWSANSNDWYENLQHWLSTFDRLVLVARVDEVESSVGGRVDGPRVSVAPIPNFRGIRQLVLRYFKVRRAVRLACSDKSAHYGGRFPGILAGLMLSRARRMGAPMLAHVVGDPQAVLRSGVAGFTGSLVSRLAGRSLRRQMQQVNAAIYVTRHQLQRIYPIRNGQPSLGRSDVLLTPESFVDRPRVYELDTHQWRLVAVGSQEQMYKGHDVLIAAIGILRNRKLDVTLRLVGAGRYHEMLQEMARRQGVADYVRFEGHVESPEEIRRILDESDLFVMPSRTEGVPRALLEAMARGLPCLGSDVGGIPELLDRESLFRPNDAPALANAIMRAIGDSHNLRRQARRNLDFAYKMLEENAPTRLTDFLNNFINTISCRKTT